MTILVESIKRLYQDGKVDLEKIKDLLKNKKITQEQYEYIINE